MNPPTQPLIAATTAKNDNTTVGNSRTNAPTKTVPTALAMAAAITEQPAQHALCLESRKNPSIASPGARHMTNDKSPKLPKGRSRLMKA